MTIATIGRRMKKFEIIRSLGMGNGEWGVRSGEWTPNLSNRAMINEL
jgi:hypothetical protein